MTRWSANCSPRWTGSGRPGSASDLSVLTDPEIRELIDELGITRCSLPEALSGPDGEPRIEWTDP
jgi:hypothetical protein